jgi:hypothetical protein
METQTVKTTVNLPRELLIRGKVVAAKSGGTLTEIIETALRSELVKREREVAAKS